MSTIFHVSSLGDMTVLFCGRPNLGNRGMFGWGYLGKYGLFYRYVLFSILDVRMMSNKSA